MANLVIKPAVGSGNKVIFQNQAGNVAAITVEDSGNITLAGTSNNLGTVTSGTLSHGTSLQGYVDASNSGVAFPSGHVLQVQGTHNDYNWGSWAHSTETVCSWVNVVLTTRGTNSNFWVTGRINADNTNTGAFGMGIGFRYQPTGGSEVIICNAHEHEMYCGPAGDYYLFNMQQIYEQDATIVKGTEVTFKIYMEFNNSNGTWASQSQHGSSHTVMEVQA
jgi:hypothetical protein|tara:strand:- start:562 stop:1221 length:660 start_codon:yes stop_codon:yes gene_type:complete